MSKDTLAVIIPDSIKALLEKGELTDRYYNPGNVFKKVYLITTYDQVTPDIKNADLQRFVGSAECELIQYPTPPFRATLGWNYYLLKKWIDNFVQIIEKLNVSMVRCHGSHLNSLLAMHVKRRLQIPYLVSLHINPDEDILKRSAGLKNKIIAHRIRQIQKKSLRGSDLVMPVYSPIVPFLQSIRVKNYQVAYNVISPSHLAQKVDYRLSSPKRIITVGRLIKEKNPEYLIRAIAGIPDVELTVVGRGELYEPLRNLTSSLQLDDRVKFIPSMPNSELCKSLPSYDLFAVHSEYWEISKAVLEALLCGMPVVINERRGCPVPELQGGIVRFVKTDPEAYKEAFSELFSNDMSRKNLGLSAYRFAQESWHPKVTEEKFASIYRNLLQLRAES